MMTKFFMFCSEPLLQVGLKSLRYLIILNYFVKSYMPLYSSIVKQNEGNKQNM